MALLWTLTLAALLLLTVTTNAEEEPELSAWWKERKPEQQTEILNVYNKCNDKDGKSLCRGIFGPDCVKGHYCDFVFRVTETDDFFQFDNLNLVTYSNEPDKQIIYTVAFAPFETFEGNFTAKCKSEITLKDFKFLVYEDDKPRRARSASSKDRNAWDDASIFDDQSKISKKNFAKSCASHLEDRNKVINAYRGRPITEYENAITKISNEYMYVLRSDYYDQYTDTEKLRFRDGQAYRYADPDKVLWSNFENTPLLEKDRKFQAPPPKSSASSLIPTFFSTALVALALIRF